MWQEFEEPPSLSSSAGLLQRLNPFRTEKSAADMSIMAYVYDIAEGKWEREPQSRKSRLPMILERAGLVDYCTLFVLTLTLTLMLLNRIVLGLVVAGRTIAENTGSLLSDIYDVSPWLAPVSVVVGLVGYSLAGVALAGAAAATLLFLSVAFVYSLATYAVTALAIPFVALGRAIQGCFSDDAAPVSRRSSYSDNPDLKKIVSKSPLEYKANVSPRVQHVKPGVESGFLSPRSPSPKQAAHPSGGGTEQSPKNSSSFESKN